MLLYQEASYIGRTYSWCRHATTLQVCHSEYCLHFKDWGVLLRPLTHFMYCHCALSLHQVTRCDLHIVASSTEMLCCYRVECLIWNIARQHCVVNSLTVKLILSSCSSSGPEPLKPRGSGRWFFAASLRVRQYQVRHTCWPVNRLREGQHWWTLFTSYMVLKQH